MLAQGRYWRAVLSKTGDSVLLSTPDGVPTESQRGVELSVPLARFGEVLKVLRPDRKLLGGALLRHLREEEHGPRLSEALASDRLFAELQRVLLDATLSLVEEGRLQLTASEAGDESS